ncbi:PorT family protein [Polaribacter sp. HaHaR_3_91]|uniref:PorT family protein n=1 Tax=Polaribacter sp. HaHaR_3_91 TaxID=2745561 RepID=UPI0020C755BC|nr:PorT family protein [Polaribacter sp. HaHaR_3_91]
MILSFSSYSQISFEKGYFIDNTNQKINCLIRTVDWNNNPTQFEYKISEKDKFKKSNLESVKEFGINGISKYIKANVNIDRSNEVISKISKNRNPEFKEEVLFLKVLIEGKANLYQYLDTGLTRYFYKTGNSNIEQLVFKSYKTVENKIGKNNQFRQQLLNDLKCPDFKMSKFKSLGYNSKDLKTIFTEYSECQNYLLNYFEPKQKRDIFNLTIRPRLNSSSLTVQNDGFTSKDVIDFGNKTGFGIGLEAEITLPIKKNKWTIFIEPTYQYFKSQKSINNVDVVFSEELQSGEEIIQVLNADGIIKVDYTSIEIPIGLRHYLLLNSNSKIFINASIIFDLSTKSSFEFNTSNSPIFKSVNIESSQNLAFGIGYKLYDKYNLEMRYQTSRDTFYKEEFWSSNYKTFSIIFGFSIL